jgi:hypothetical protein
MSDVTFDPRSADLRAPAAAVEVLLAGGADALERLAEEDRAALEAAGALVDGSRHEQLELARATVAEPVVTLRLERGERRASIWMRGDTAVLVHPLAGADARLVLVSPPLLVDALVRLNDVGPRPRAPRPVRIALGAGALAEALAARDASRAGLADPEVAAVLADVVAGLREHWRVTASWEPSEGSLDGRTVEVLDTASGYWMAIPDGDRVELWPTTPSAVYRALCSIFPLVSEIRDLAGA